MSLNQTLDLTPEIAKELSLPQAGVAAVMQLLAEGATVPFIARYRKEATGGLDEVQIRAIGERRAYLIDLNQRRDTITEAIDQQGKLTPSLKAKLQAAQSKSELEDLYLPYKKKRRTRAMIARERGLLPLAERILAQPSQGKPTQEAASFINSELEVPDADAALAGARDIVAEVIAENMQVRASVRREYGDNGVLASSKARGVSDEPNKFEQYYDFSEKVKSIPSHRFLAIRRGESESILKAKVEVDSDRLALKVQRLMLLSKASPFAEPLTEAITDSLKRLLGPSVESEVRIDLKLRSDLEAIQVFGDNLRNLLLAAPLGGKPIIGIDPGLRTGCKCVAVDATGKYLGTTTINLVRGDPERAKRDLLALLSKYPPEAIAVGNGTGGRETESFVRRLCKDEGLSTISVVQVNEAGASVYSASDIAREEFPDLDLTLRGAISIARRLQDPLAELVKLDPKVIGVGQYQHDVNQPLLQRKLGEVVESCVNHVGVVLNTASASLLSYVAGIGNKMAGKIVAHREAHGAFESRAQLLKVAGLGPRVFEQAGGFLRIHKSAHVLDASAVHPERYSLVERMAQDLSVPLAELVGNAALTGSIDANRYVDGQVGLPTLKDIIAELAKPGRDPRAVFEAPKFRDDVHQMSDLVVGMSLEGVVTNVTAFGAFVDIGVHQDGLVHVSKLSDRFVKDAAQVVRVGDKLKVHVMDVDMARKRISLSARSEDGQKAGTAPKRDAAAVNTSRTQEKRRAPQNPPANRSNRASAHSTKGDRSPKGASRSPKEGNRANTQNRQESQSKPQDKGGFANNPFANLGKKRS